MNRIKSFEEFSNERGLNGGSGMSVSDAKSIEKDIADAYEFVKGGCVGDFSPRIIVVRGRGGVGKSSVVFSALRKLGVGYEGDQYCKVCGYGEDMSDVCCMSGDRLIIADDAFDMTSKRNVAMLKRVGDGVLPNGEQFNGVLVVITNSDLDNDIAARSKYYDIH